MRSPPVAGADWKAWAEDVRRHLSRMGPQLEARNATSSAAEDGALVWDRTYGYPVVSKGGAWRRVVLGDPLFKTPEDFGAVGDGVADDTTALNNALTGGGHIVGKFGAIYKITASVNVPSDTILDLNGSQIKRGFAGGWAIRNATGLTTANDTNIVLKNIWIVDNGDPAARGNGLWLNGASRVEITNFRVTFSAPYDAVNGAWSAWIAGDDIRINGYAVNTTAAGLWSDGIHLGQVSRFVMTNFDIVAGDDGIAMHYPPASYNWLDGDSDGIAISGGYVKSASANGIRIGAFGSASTITPSDTGVWENVSISDVVIGACGVSSLHIFDDRTSIEIASKKNGPVSFINIQFEDASTRSIRIKGNPDITNAANYSQRNWSTLIFDRVDGTNTQAQLLEGGGVDEIIFSSCRLRRDQSGAPTSASFTVQQVAKLSLKDCYVLTDGTGIGLNLSMVARTILEDTEIEGTGAEFALVQLVKNTTFDSDLLVTDGRLNNAARLLYATGTGNIDEFVVKGTLLENAGTQETNITSAVTRYIYVPADRLTWGTYTPTLFNTTNVAASTAYACQWKRVGAMVTVSGKIDIDATAAATDTVLGMSLPVASNFTAAEQLGGTGGCLAAGVKGEPMVISGDAVNNRALIELRPSTVTNNGYSFTMAYQVL